MIQWTSYALDKLVAPGVSQFREADVPDVASEFVDAEHWLANHALNTLVSDPYRPGARQAVIGFLRRAQSALAAYTEARERTRSFLAAAVSGDPGIGRYYAAVSAWEAFALYSGIAIELFRWLNAGKGVFSKGDGSVEQRLHTMANQIKHTGKCIDAGQCTPEHTIPLWLSNAGIESFQVSVSYAEAAQILKEICGVADKLQNPRNFIEQ
jgi:hypothetical protein